GRRKRITDEMKEQLLEELQPGYYVERHLLDGDVAIFNRQPSLHRMSMMCHRVKVLPNKTFRLNPAVCVPYNADFDGDEMNLHIPQTEEARAEAEILMQVHTQLISPRYGLSIIGCVQDAISGNYMLTRYMKMSREDAVELLISARIFDLSRLPKKETVTGKEIFSVVLPQDFNFEGKTRLYSNDEKKDKANDAVVSIKAGKLLSGAMDKANLGEGSGLMLKNLHQQYGAEQTLEILGKMFRLGIESLLKYGFTTVISDTDLPEESRQRIRKILDDAYGVVDEFIDTYRQGKLDAFPGRTVEETLELRILERLNIARNETGNIVGQNADVGSHTVIMTTCGSRGNPLNLAQMAACVGQQAMRGKRIQKGYRGRTLSCFQRGDLSPNARGFIRGSFKSGLGPAEFFFGAMTGRDSLMDTALRTPKSGYLYRRLANALQDMRVAYDGTVRDANGMIVQFKYGEDNIDVSKSEKGKLNVQRLFSQVME
ncbi:MAG: DNA-directed RNA polymerase subunit A', partial [Nanoarchaeota archaeon]